MRNTLSRAIILVLISALLLIITNAGSVMVIAASPVISLSQTSGPPGTLITVTGSGFGANETGITITYDGNPVTTGISANSLGNWSGTLTIPPSASGSHIINAYGSTTPASSVPSASFTVVTPAISVSRTSGPPGTLITVTGSGFGANEIGITITYDGNPVTTGISANSLGNWSDTFTVPPSASGSHIISAYGSITSASLVLGVTFTVVNPTVTVSRTSGPPGTQITVTGYGFEAGETGITITYDTTPVASGISANYLGSWSGTFTIPPSVSGSHSISAYGSATTASSVSATAFVVTPVLIASRTSGPPGTHIMVTGYGFGDGETGITITYDATLVASGISANSQGSWSNTFTVPASASGSHIINASGSVTLPGSLTGITFTVSPTITLNQMNASPGTLITVNGFGFGSDETGITIIYDGSPVASGITADSVGSWKTTFTVPSSASGSHSVSAYGSTTLSDSVTGVTLTLSPAITTSQASGPPGTLITVTGSGFGAGETGITITYDSSPVASGITANSLGNWSGTFIVPASASSSHSIRAYGMVTQVSSVAEVNFKITPSITINPAAGYVGETVVVNGYGFAANSPLTITYDDQEISSVGVNTDATGSFAESFATPKSKGGNHIINVADWQKNSAKATFSIDTTPPAIPTPLSPKDGARIGVLGGITPTFMWSNVTDPNGVAYTLDVDTSPDFSNPVLEKTDITVNHYTLTAAEALPYGRYYWRVKAIDGASNESSWSAVQLLKSGLMLLWTLVVLIVFGITVVGLGTYFGLRWLRRRQREHIAAPEIVVPQIVTGQWRELESEETPGERQLPWRLALPGRDKAAKTLTTQDQARLKVIIDFAQSLPLVEADYNVDWLVDLIETETGTRISVPVYEQLLKGELQVHYEPTWLRHPAYQELTTLLQKQAILQELNTFVSDADHCATEAVSLLQQIYHDAVSELPEDFLNKGGWRFISAVYADAMNWFAGKSLRDPSEWDYTIKSVGDLGAGTPAESWLYGEESTSFAGELMLVTDTEEASRLRVLHIRLRRNYRGNDQARQVAAMVTQIQLQRGRLLGTFRQFDRLKR